MPDDKQIPIDGSRLVKALLIQRDQQAVLIAQQATDIAYLQATLSEIQEERAKLVEPDVQPLNE